MNHKLIEHQSKDNISFFLFLNIYYVRKKDYTICFSLKIYFFDAVERQIQQKKKDIFSLLSIFICFFFWNKYVGNGFIVDYYQWPSYHAVYVRQDTRLVYQLNMCHVCQLNRTLVWLRIGLHLKRTVEIL